MFLCKGRWMQFVLVMAQWEGLKGTRASRAPEPIVSVFSGPAFWVSGRFTESFSRWTASSKWLFMGKHALSPSQRFTTDTFRPATVYRTPISTQTHTDTQTHNGRDLMKSMQMHACHSCMHTYMIMICTWNHTLPYNEKDLKQAMIFNIIY